MTSHINDELNRLQSTFSSLITEISHQTQQGRRLGEQVADEETPISNTDNNDQTLQMPGGFTFPSQPPNNIQSLETQGESPLSRGINKVFSIVFTTLMIIILVPVYIFYRLFVYILFIIFSLFKKVHRHGYRSVRSNDPIDTARKFVVRFDQRIGNNERRFPAETESTEELTHNQDTTGFIREDHLTEIERPDFLESSYSNALFVVKKQKRWLLVYIESELSQEVNDFTKDVLINPRFLHFIKERDILVWGGDVTDPEAYQACNQFNITRMPFLGLFCLTVNQIPTSSGMNESAPVLSLVAKIQGYRNLNATLKKLDQSYRKYNPALSRLRLMTTGRNELTANTGTSQSQSRSTPSSGRLNSSETTSLDPEALKMEWLRWRKSKLKPECTTSGNFARIAIRLPDGSRKQFKFDKTSTTEEIYAYVECNLLNDVDLGNEIEFSEPSGYQHEYKFKLFSILPKEEVAADECTPIETLEVLYPSGNLLVDIV